MTVAPGLAHLSTGTGSAVDPDVVPGLRIEVVEEAGSTNALVLERARGGADGGLVVVAEHQSAGRGRLDRSWETPARSALTFSLLLRPRSRPARGPGCRCSRATPSTRRWTPPGTTPA